MFKFKTKLVLEQFNKDQARFNFDPFPCRMRFKKV